MPGLRQRLREVRRDPDRGAAVVEFVMVSVLLILLYIFAMKLTTVAASNAGLDPLIAVWIPNVLFALVGIWIYRKAPK